MKKTIQTLVLGAVFGSLSSLNAQNLTVDYLTVRPETRGWPEGGEIQLQGAGGNPNWLLDAFQDRFRIHSAGTEHLILTSDGRFGLGTGFPQAKLDVNGDVFLSGSAARTISAANRLHISAPENLYLNPWAGSGSVIVGGGGGTPNLIVTGSAEVRGTTTTQVLYITGGSDLAEMFEIAGEAQPGWVVCADATRGGSLTPASQAYDQAVIGVVSGAGGVNPGLTLTQENSVAAGRHPVAMVGRVFCWCDAGNGEIKPGTLLTTSDTLGHAMKATDRVRAQGAMMGKALGSLKTGRGLVLIAVGLR